MALIKQWPLQFNANLTYLKNYSLYFLIFQEFKKENEKLLETNSKVQIDNQGDIKSKMLIDDRKQQLECEVQYFKQQIEILLVENNHLNG